MCDDQYGWQRQFDSWHSSDDQQNQSAAITVIGRTEIGNLWDLKKNKYPTEVFISGNFSICFFPHAGIDWDGRVSGTKLWETRKIKCQIFESTLTHLYVVLTLIINLASNVFSLFLILSKKKKRKLSSSFFFLVSFSFYFPFIFMFSWTFVNISHIYHLFLNLFINILIDR